MYRTSRSSCAGVTLLDVAVALVIASFLFAGIVRGSELISSAHTKRISTDISNVTAAFLIYQDRYRSIAGDDASAAARWDGAKNGNGDGVLSGHYDDPAPLNASAFVVDQTQGESLNFWWHLRLAGLLTGPDSGADATTPPMHALGGRMGIQQGAFGMQGPVLCFDGIAQQMAATLDRQIDDGQPGSGSLRAGPADGNLLAYQLNGSDLTVCVSLNGSRAGLPGPLYPPSAVPSASAVGSSAAPQSVAPSTGASAPADGSSAAPPSVAPGSSGNGNASSNGQQNGQNGTGPGNNGNGNGNGASSNASGQINGNGQQNGQNGTGPGNNGNGNGSNAKAAKKPRLTRLSHTSAP
jgi:hypothetical protein